MIYPAVAKKISMIPLIERHFQKRIQVIKGVSVICFEKDRIQTTNCLAGSLDIMGCQAWPTELRVDIIP